MAIRTGGKGRARADRVSGARANSTTRYASKDVPQFAPNFTIYLLPPDAVALYSEHRKFFLHGELYCALASTIGKGGSSFRDIVRALQRDFPTDKIDEALTRLIERGYIVPALPSS